MTFIRWIGGKNILSKKIYSLVEDLDTSELDYYEPFLGSGIGVGSGSCTGSGFLGGTGF